jgi:hypothetical protein
VRGVNRGGVFCARQEHLWTGLHHSAATAARACRPAIQRRRCLRRCPLVRCAGAAAGQHQSSQRCPQKVRQCSVATAAATTASIAGVEQARGSSVRLRVRRISTGIGAARDSEYAAGNKQQRSCGDDHGGGSSSGDLLEKLTHGWRAVFPGWSGIGQFVIRNGGRMSSAD